MKRICFIITTCLLAAASFNSCVMESSDYTIVRGTEKAYQMFRYWRYGYSNTQMRFANVAFNFNAWLSAPESARDSVAYVYFKDYTIRDNGNGSWSLLYQYREAYKIETHNKLLSEPGAAWTVTEKERVSDYMPLYSNGYNEMYDFQTSPVTATISCPLQGQWTVKINDSEDVVLGGPVAHLSVILSTPDQSVIQDLREGGYNISGHGYFEFARYPYTVSSDVPNVVGLYFNITEPLYCDGQDRWSEGALTINVNNGETGPDYKSETTDVKFTVTAAPGSTTSSHYAVIHYYDREAMWQYDGRYADCVTPIFE